MTVPTTLTGTHDGCGGSVVFRPVTQRRELLAGHTVTLRAACRSCGTTLSIQWSMADAGIQSEALPMAAGGETAWQPRTSPAPQSRASVVEERVADDGHTHDGGNVTEMAGWVHNSDREAAPAKPDAHPAPAVSADSGRDEFLQQFAKRFEAARQAVRRVRDDLPNVGTTASPMSALPAREPFAAPAAPVAPVVSTAAAPVFTPPAASVEPAPVSVEPAPAVVEPAASFRVPQLRDTVSDPAAIEPVMVEPDVAVPTLPAPVDVMTAPMGDADAPLSPTSVQDAIAAISADAPMTETADEYEADPVVDEDPVACEDPVAFDEPAAHEEPVVQELPLALATTDIASTTDDVVAAEAPAAPMGTAAPIAPDVPAVPSLVPQALPEAPVVPAASMLMPVPVALAPTPAPEVTPVAGPPAPPAPLGFPTSMLPAPATTPVAAQAPPAPLAPPAPVAPVTPAMPDTVQAAGMQPDAVASMPVPTSALEPPAPPAPPAAPDFEPTRGFDWGREQSEDSASNPAKQRTRRGKKHSKGEDEVVPNDSFSEHSTPVKTGSSGQKMQWILVAGLVVVLAFLTFKVVSSKLTSEPVATTPDATLPAKLPTDTVDPAATPATTPTTAKKPAAGAATPKAKTTTTPPKDPLADAASGAATQDSAKAADTGATGRDPFATK